MSANITITLRSRPRYTQAEVEAMLEEICRLTDPPPDRPPPAAAALMPEAA